MRATWLCVISVLTLGAAASPEQVPPSRSTSAAILTLIATARVRPQNVDQTIGAAGSTTVLFDDESLRTTVTVSFPSMAQRDAFSTTFPVLVLQRRDIGGGRWRDVHTFSSTTDTGQKRPDPRTSDPKPTTPVNRKPEPKLGTGRVDAPPALPQDPRKGPQPRTGPPFGTPRTFVPGLSFESPSLNLPVGTVAIRASARRTDGTSLESSPLQTDVRAAPAVLTLLAMGGACVPDPDGNTSHKTLSEARITRDESACAAKGVPSTYLADLTPMSSVNCNDPCNPNCKNFFEHLGLRMLNDRHLANQMNSINNPGTELCRPTLTNPSGIRNHIIFGKWRNTEEEPLCSTPIDFNRIIDNFVNQGGRSLILIGQSHGGAKLAGMVRDHWRWGNALTLELIVLWDASSLESGVRKVGNRPKRVLSFFQYGDVPIQNGTPLDPSEHHDQLEQHDLNKCFSHNAIARSQFVHHRTAEVVGEALQAARDRARRR
jgi:hypothetical protein